jgi:hypothetical protein
VTISGEVSPPGATIRLEGKELKNPFEIHRPAKDGTAELVFSAPGYLTQRFEVSLARGGAWTVGLIRERTRPATTPRKKPAGRKQFLENPYE